MDTYNNSGKLHITGGGQPFTSNEVIAEKINYDLDIVKSQSLDRLAVGDTQVYTFTITNHGSEIGLGMATLEDNLPVGMQFITDSLKLNGTVQIGSVLPFIIPMVIAENETITIEFSCLVIA